MFWVGPAAGAASHVEVEEDHADDRGRRDVRLSRALDGGNLIRRHQTDEVHAPGHHLRDRGRDLGDGPEHEGLHRGLLTPVGRARLHDETLSAGPLDEAIRPAPDRVFRDEGVALLLDVGRRNDGQVRQPLEEHRIGLLGLEADGQVVDDLDRSDPLEAVPQVRLLGGVEHAVDAELHRLRIHGLAVLELDALPDLELPREVVNRPPRFRETAHELHALWIARDQVVEDVHEHHVVDGARRLMRIERLPVGIERRHELPSRLGDGTRRDPDHDGQHHHKTTREPASSHVHPPG